MKTYEIAKKIIIDSDGIATTFDFKTAGLEKYSISNLCKDGLIVRIRHGYYSLPDSLVAEEQLLSINGVATMDSSLIKEVCSVVTKDHTYSISGYIKDSS